ncbi:MAG: acyl-CoA thioesterase-1 [Planctomycetota bacterium]
MNSRSIRERLRCSQASDLQGSVPILRSTLLVLLLLPAGAVAGHGPSQVTSQVPVQAPRIVCLGDSLTEGYQVAPEFSWPSLIEKRLHAGAWPGAVVVNAGVSGSTSASALSRLNWQLRNKPDVLILALGANDGLRGIDPPVTRKNLAATIDAAKAEGIAVLLGGMRMPPNYGADYTREFQAVFTSLAAEKQVAFLPFLLEGVAARPELNQADGIHPTAAGYEIVAETVLGFLTPLLNELLGETRNVIREEATP